MENWKELNSYEKGILLPYLKYRARLSVIFFTAVKYFGAFYGFMGFIYYLQSIKTLPLVQTVFFPFFLFIGIGMFCFIPHWLLRLCRREITAIEYDLARATTTIILEKARFSNIGGHRRKCHIRVNVDGINDDIWIEIDSISYNKLNIGDLCNIVFFPLKSSDKLVKPYMLAFDDKFENIEQLNTMYKL